MNPSGLWKGKCENRVGNFKFINVEILPEKSTGKSEFNIYVRILLMRYLTNFIRIGESQELLS
jgi:hypothetical protein